MRIYVMGKDIRDNCYHSRILQEITRLLVPLQIEEMKKYSPKDRTLGFVTTVRVQETKTKYLLRIHQDLVSLFSRKMWNINYRIQLQKMIDWNHIAVAKVYGTIEFLETKYVSIDRNEKGEPEKVNLDGDFSQSLRHGTLIEYAPKKLRLEHHDMSWDQKYDILKMVADGMRYLHERNVAHTRLCLKNILLSEDRKIPKIINNEILLSLETQMKRKSRTLIKYRREFMKSNRSKFSNYQWKYQPIELRKCLDVYSFGCIMYEVTMKYTKVGLGLTEYIKEIKKKKKEKETYEEEEVTEKDRPHFWYSFLMDEILVGSSDVTFEEIFQKFEMYVGFPKKDLEERIEFLRIEKNEMYFERVRIKLGESTVLVVNKFLLL